MTIHYSKSEHVAIVTLDRPEALNALDLDSLKALRAALATARDDDDVRVIVLTGAGSKSFCVGADLKNTLPPETSFASSFVRRKCTFSSTEATQLLGMMWCFRPAPRSSLANSIS